VLLARLFVHHCFATDACRLFDSFHSYVDFLFELSVLIEQSPDSSRFQGPILPLEGFVWNAFVIGFK
jgi:hypothetical protein